MSDRIERRPKKKSIKSKDDAPPRTPDQIAFEAFWIDLKGAGFVGFGRDKNRQWDYAAEFARDAYKAWAGAQAYLAKQLNLARKEIT